MANEETISDTTAAGAQEPVSTWSPLRHQMFRALWLAASASNVGTWMHDVGASWLMTSISSSALMIALVQTATSLPVFVLSLPAGALADIVDRRRILLITQIWMALAAVTLGVLTLFGVATPWILLASTFALSIGSAVNGPAWQATTPSLVPRRELGAAVALSSASLNLARAVGPALGGLVVSTFGPGAVFLLNALSYFGVIWVIYRWRTAPEEAFAPAERVIGASRAGLRYMRYAPPLKAVLVRTGAFMLFGSAFWSLLPTVGRQVLKLDSVGYGLLLGAFGAGAVLGAIWVDRLRRRVSSDMLVAAGTLVFAASTVALGYLRHIRLLYITMALGGIAWIALMSTMNVSAQVSSPAWVRARALALYLLMYMGGMAIGSPIWGTVATTASPSTALLVAAIGMLLTLAAAPFFTLPAAEGSDLTPSKHWPDPVLAFEPEEEDGPVLITVEYRVLPENGREFLRAMRVVGRQRRRDGAMRWNIYRDVSDPTRYVETFVVENWGEHLRQHARVTINDRSAEEAARGFHVGDGRPVVTHLISARRRRA